MEETTKNNINTEDNEFKDVELMEDDEKEEVQKVYDKHSGLTFKIPEDFRICEETGEIYKFTKDGPKRISPNLIWITGIIHNLDDDTEKLKLQIEKRGKIKEGIFLKSQVYSSPMELANFGIPINVTNSRNIIQYLAELEAENQDSIPVIKAVSKLGWREGKFLPFSKDSDIVIDIDYKLQKWINGYTAKGTLEEWIEYIKPYRDNSIFRFIMAASFAAPLLTLIGHRIFIVFNWGNSRAGKTSALKAALSVWGNPEDLTHTFNTTAVGIERLAGFHNDLPLGLDEKQVNKSQTDIEKMIYMLGNGISKIRGNKTGGIQQMNTWNTIILATGEETISTTNSTTGVQTRCLEIEGSPYNYDERKASQMYNVISQQYGTAGPFFINKLIQVYGQDDYKTLKEEYQKIFKQVENNTENDILSYVSSVSMVTLADILIGKWLFDEGEEKSFEMATDILNNLDSSKDIDVVDKCYEYIVSWIKGNHKSFDTYKENKKEYEKTLQKMNIEDDLTDTDRTKKSFGIYDDGVYYLLRYILEDKLQVKGFNYRKMVSEFAKRGYIKPTRDDDGYIITNTVQKKYRGTNTRFFAFPVEMMEKRLSEEEKIIEEKNLHAQLMGYKDNKDKEEKFDKYFPNLITEDKLENAEELVKLQNELEERGI